jgi:hypothetical protein
VKKLCTKRIARKCRHVIEDALYEWELGEVEREFFEVILAGMLESDHESKPYGSA